MAKFYIAYDERDVELGLYFKASKDDIHNFINLNCSNPSVFRIPSRLCNQVYIDTTISQINSEKFLFLAYSHGNKDSLKANSEAYINALLNTNIFKNSFFYSMSCSTGINLGPALISNDCKAFIGYKDDAWSFSGAYAQLCIDCDNYGLKQFISGRILEAAFDQMKNNFSSSIDLLEQNGEIVLAALLRENRDALVLLGDKNLNFNSF